MAHAIERELKCDGAIIKPTIAWVIKGDLAIKYCVPASVAREILSFDRHHDFRPGEYQLSAVYKCRRMDADNNHSEKRRGRKHRKTSTRKPLVVHSSGGMRGRKAAVSH